MARRSSHATSSVLTGGRLLALVAVLCLVVGAVLSSEPRLAHSQSAPPVPLAGFAWSDTIGWISLNCISDPNGCSSAAGNWGLSADGSGLVTGYAWSDTVGWVSANNSYLVGCPTGTCSATLTSGALSGWFKAISADNNGWDGWISLSGSGYGPVQTNNIFSGYAWGGNVVGWVDFSQAYTPCTPLTTYICTGTGNQTIAQQVTGSNCQVSTPQLVVTCVTPGFCQAGSPVCQYPKPTVNAALAVKPSLTIVGSSVAISWNISNVLSCTVSGTNKDGTAQSTDTNSPGVWNTLSGSQKSSPIRQPVTYTLSCLQDDGVTYLTQTASVGLAPNYEER